MGGSSGLWANPTPRGKVRSHYGVVGSIRRLIVGLGAIPVSSVKDLAFVVHSSKM